MNDKIIFLFVGPPGCGKGTQGKKLVNHFGVDKCSYFEMGQYLRDRREEDSAFDQLCLRYDMDNGGLLPLNELEGIVQTQINHFVKSNAKFLVLDGYPRTIEQLESLADLLKRYEDLKVFYFHFKSDKKECMLRIVSRANSSTSKRSDDNEGVARERYQKYEEMTLPMIEQLDSFFGAGSGRVVSPGTIEKVFNYIITVIDYLNQESQGYSWIDDSPYDDLADDYDN